MGNVHEIFGEVRPCGFRVMRADRHTDTLIAILHTPSGGGSEVMTEMAQNGRSFIQPILCHRRRDSLVLSGRYVYARPLVGL